MMFLKRNIMRSCKYWGQKIKRVFFFIFVGMSLLLHPSFQNKATLNNTICFEMSNANLLYKIDKYVDMNSVQLQYDRPITCLRKK